jgi:Delta24(24(1))-sterol reductase
MPGFVETPGRRRSRKSILPGHEGSVTPEPDSLENSTSSLHKLALASNYSNGHANGSAKHSSEKEHKPISDHRIDTSGHYEFGGAWGVSALMVGFPILMWYMWIGATYYGGKVPLPEAGQSFGDFLKHLVNLVYVGAYPSAKAWTIYWTFFIVQGVFYLYLPGVYSHGKPLEHLGGKQLPYYCSGLYSWYLTIALAIGLHFTGLFKLYTIIEEFGPLMTVAIISGFAVSVVAYISALARGAQHRMTGNHVYDFFMGAELNPRLLGWLDFKMFFEVRLPWYILFLLSLATAFLQLDRYGYVSGEVGFLLMAHFLYANACSKAEELIVTTW